MSWTTPLAGIRWVDTVTDDTLQDVAARELGDAARWPELVALNGLEPPYLTDDPSAVTATVARAGLPIRVPAPATVVSGVADDADTLFGRDLAAARGSLTATEYGDLATVAGTENLTQAIGIRIRTSLGELLHHRAYGCGAPAVGSANDPVTNALAASSVATALLADPRIARAERVQATSVGDQLRVTGTAVAADGRRVPFRTA